MRDIMWAPSLLKSAVPQPLSSAVIDGVGSWVLCRQLASSASPSPESKYKSKGSDTTFEHAASLLDIKGIKPPPDGTSSSHAAGSNATEQPAGSSVGPHARGTEPPHEHELSMHAGQAQRVHGLQAERTAQQAESWIGGVVFAMLSKFGLSSTKASAAAVPVAASTSGAASAVAQPSASEAADQGSSLQDPSPSIENSSEQISHVQDVVTEQAASSQPHAASASVSTSASAAARARPPQQSNAASEASTSSPPYWRLGADLNSHPLRRNPKLMAQVDAMSEEQLDTPLWALLSAAAAHHPAAGAASEEASVISGPPLWSLSLRRRAGGVTTGTADGADGGSSSPSLTGNHSTAGTGTSTSTHVHPTAPDLETGPLSRLLSAKAKRQVLHGLEQMMKSEAASGGAGSRMRSLDLSDMMGGKRSQRQVVDLSTMPQLTPSPMSAQGMLSVIAGPQHVARDRAVQQLMPAVVEEVPANPYEMRVVERKTPTGSRVRGEVSRESRTNASSDWAELLQAIMPGLPAPAQPAPAQPAPAQPLSAVDAAAASTAQVVAAPAPVTTPAPVVLTAQQLRSQMLKQKLEVLEAQASLLKTQLSQMAVAIVPEYSTTPSVEESISRNRPVMEVAGKLRQVHKQLDDLKADIAGVRKPVAMDALDAEQKLRQQKENAERRRVQQEARRQAALERTEQEAQRRETSDIDDLFSALGPVPQPSFAPSGLTDPSIARQRQQRRSDQQAAAPGAAGKPADWVQSLKSELGVLSTPTDSQAVSRTAGKQQQQPALTESKSKSVEEQLLEDLDDVLLPPGERAARKGRTLFEQPEDDQPLELPSLITVRALANLLGAPPSEVESFLAKHLGENVSSLEDAVPPEAAELVALEWGRVAVVARDAALSAPPKPRPAVITIMGHVDHGKTSLLDALRKSNVAAGEAGGITQHIGAFEVSLPGAPLPLTFLDTPGHSAFSSMRARGAAVTDVVVLVVSAEDGVMPQTREALAHARSAGCPIVVALTKCDLPTARPDQVATALLGEGLELEVFGGAVQLVHTSARTGLGLDELTEALLLQAEVMDLKAPESVAAAATVVEASVGRSGPTATVIVRRGRLRVGDAVVVGTEWGTVRALRTSSGDVAGGSQGVGAGQHALIMGLHGLPQAGDELLVVPDVARARRISAARAERAEDYRRLQNAAALHSQRTSELAKAAQISAARREYRQQRMALLAQRKLRTAQQLAELAAKYRASQEAAAAAESAASLTLTTATGAASAAMADSAPAAAASGTGSTIRAPAVRQEVRLVIKADVAGSTEAVRALAAELSNEHVEIKVVHAGVGPLTQNDVNLAMAAGAHVVTFNLGAAGTGGAGAGQGRMVEEALAGAKAMGVTHLSHNVIYHLMDQIRGLVEGAAPYVEVEEEVGRATVLATFPLSGPKSAKKAANLPPGGGKIAGVRVGQGAMRLGAARLRVLRNGVVIYEGALTSLRRHKLDVDAVGSGNECGLVVDGGAYSAFQLGDELVCVDMVRRKAGTSAATGTGTGGH